MSKGFTGSIEFTPLEQKAHDAQIKAIVAGAVATLKDTWNDHVEFFEKHKVSRYYGDRNSAYSSPADRIAALRKAGADVRLEHELRSISCIGLALESMSSGFKAPADPLLTSMWDRIHSYVMANDLDGTALIDALRKLGWRVYYWNPDPSKNAEWDREDGDRRSRGWHAERYRTVMQSNRYYFNEVDDKSLLVGFKTTIPRKFLEIPFFIGAAHTGYHIFPGLNGEVIEAHSMRKLDSFDNLERSQFNPLKSGGGPRWTDSEKYRSGIICAPPAF